MEVREQIQAIGGVAVTARLFRISEPAVYEWIRNNRIPDARLVYLEAFKPRIFRPKRKAP